MHKQTWVAKAENNDTELKKNVPKSIAYYFFILQVVFGMDFGFTKCLNKKNQPFAKFVSVLFSLVVFIIMCAPLMAWPTELSDYVVFFVWSVSPAVQYAIHFIILSITKYTIYEFVKNITNIEHISELRSEKLGFAAFGYTFVIFCIKYGSLIVECNDAGEKCGQIFYISYYVYGPPSLSLDTISSILSLIYYYIYCCVKKLKTSAKEMKLDIMKIEKFYLDLAEIYNKIVPLYNRLVLVELMFEMPKLMTLVYNILCLIKSQFSWVVISVEVIYACHVFIRILIPSIMAEMVNHEVNCTKQILHYQLLKQEDAKKLAKLRGLLRYMGVVRLQHRIGRVVPVDIRLPLSVLSLSVTYLIVIVQFTHLYD